MFDKLSATTETLTVVSKPLSTSDTVVSFETDDTSAAGDPAASNVSGDVPADVIDDVISVDMDGGVADAVDDVDVVVDDGGDDVDDLVDDVIDGITDNGFEDFSDGDADDGCMENFSSVDGETEFEFSFLGMTVFIICGVEKLIAAASVDVPPTYLDGT